MRRPPNERRDQIFALGAELFAEKGYERASLRELADLLGVTKPALYYYYSSKEQLLFEIMSFVMDRVLQDLKDVAEARIAPPEKIREFIRRYVLFFAAHRNEHAIMSTEVDSLGPELRTNIIERQRLYLAYLRQIVAEVRSPDSNVDETSVAFALLGAMNWLFKWYDPAGRLSPEKLVDDFYQIYARGLLGSHPPGAPP